MNAPPSELTADVADNADKESKRPHPWRVSLRKDDLVNVSDVPAPSGQRFPKALRRFKPAPPAYAVKRRRIVRQHRFALKTPAAQNAFQAAQVPVARQQGIRCRARQRPFVP